MITSTIREWEEENIIQKPPIIMTSRYNNKTWEETTTYRAKERTDENKVKCVYCCPRKISKEISNNSLLFVIEMNNDTNKIEGIGLIRNKVRYDNKSRVHEQGNFNRYIYTGKNRLDVSELPSDLVELLNIILFKGKRHSKRGIGLIRLNKGIITPELKLLYDYRLSWNLCFDSTTTTMKEYSFNL